MKKRRKSNFDPIIKNKQGVECFYQSLIAFGILLRLVDNEIVIESPHQNLSPVLRQEVEKRKYLLIRLLREKGE